MRSGSSNTREDFLIHEAPYPQYSYTGENLSEDPRAEIYLEDHYYDQTATAEVFKRVEVGMDVLARRVPRQ